MKSRYRPHVVTAEAGVVVEVAIIEDNPRAGIVEDSARPPVIWLNRTAINRLMQEAMNSDAETWAYALLPYQNDKGQWQNPNGHYEYWCRQCAVYSSEYLGRVHIAVHVGAGAVLSLGIIAMDWGDELYRPVPYLFDHFTDDWDEIEARATPDLRPASCMSRLMAVLFSHIRYTCPADGSHRFSE